MKKFARKVVEYAILTFTAVILIGVITLTLAVCILASKIIPKIKKPLR